MSKIFSQSGRRDVMEADSRLDEAALARVFDDLLRFEQWVAAAPRSQAELEIVIRDISVRIPPLFMALPIVVWKDQLAVFPCTVDGLRRWQRHNHDVVDVELRRRGARSARPAVPGGRCRDRMGR